MTSKELGNIATKYTVFQDIIFGIRFDGEKLHIGNSDNVIIVGNDLIINGELLNGTQGHCRLLTNPNKIKIDRETFDTWWTKR